MKTPYEMIKILATQLQTMTDNEYAYDDENGTSVLFDYVNTYLETMDGMNFDVEEGYYTVETEESEDCDHGPCKGYTFENGWIMWTYPDKPDVVSFHPNHVKAIEEFDDTGLTTDERATINNLLDSVEAGLKQTRDAIESGKIKGKYFSEIIDTVTESDTLAWRHHDADLHSS